MNPKRRELFSKTIALGIFFAAPGATAITTSCSVNLSSLAVETLDTPFFEHFHWLQIPVNALVTPPVEGLTIRTSSLDPESCNVEALHSFARQTGLQPQALRAHTHKVKINQAQLKRIAHGEKNVEVRVVSENGNYVHNFLITASPAILAVIRKL